MTKKIVLSLMFALFFLPSCKKETKNISNVVTDFDKHYSITSSFEEATSLFTVDIRLDSTIHAYAEGEKIGKPVSLAISPDNGWSTDGPLGIPKGVSKKLGELGEAVVLEGDIRLSQKLKKGNGPGVALLHLQVCTNNTCDRPRTHKLVIK